MSSATQSPGPPGDPMARARARSESKNEAVREQLEPLLPGERPRAVTIAASAAMLMAIANVIAFALGDHGDVDDRRGEVAQFVLFTGVLVAAAAGAWKAKYWAVLGIQTILALQVIILFLSITRAESAWVVALFLAIIVASSTLFWYLIRAMARIRMPDTPEAAKVRAFIDERKIEPEDLPDD